MPFPVRGFNLVESVLRHTPEELRRFIRRMPALKLNTLIVHYDYGWKRRRELILEETAKAGVEICLMTFAPRSFLRYADYKPEWLSKKADGSPHTRELICETQLCAAQPEAIEAFAHGAALWLQELPAAIRRVHVRPGDGFNFCECPYCRQLYEGDRWQPFLDAFARVASERRPDLLWEIDAYVKRYRPPSRPHALDGCDRVMYDTFFRCGFVPIGQEGWSGANLGGCTSEPHPDAREPNVWHFKRMGDWARLLPGKVYVHENLMGQALLGVNQHNTGALLQDLAAYRSLGIQGVCYEAYEPGYAYFAAQIEILAAAMMDERVVEDYRPTALETELRTRWKMRWFCDDPAFPVERFFEDPVERTHVRNYADHIRHPSAASLHKLFLFVLEHPQRFDWLFAGFFGCEWAKAIGGVDFSAAQAETRRLLSHRKLWDYMEGLPPDVDPHPIVRALLLNAVESAR